MKASDNKFAKLIIQEAASDGSDFSNPDADYRVLFLGEDGLLHVRDSAGTVSSPYSSSGAFVGCSATRTTDQTGVATATLTSVSFNGTDDFDTDAFHDPSSNPSRITIPTGKDGKYRFSTYLIWDTNATGYRRVSLSKNGSVLFTHSHPAVAGGADYTQQIATFPVVTAVATDYFETQVYQNSGGNRTLSASLATIRFTAEYLGT